MSVLVESLLGDLRSVFGEDFGEMSPELLDEARRTMKQAKEFLRQQAKVGPEMRRAHRAERAAKSREEKTAKQTKKIERSSDPRYRLAQRVEKLRQKKKHSERISAGLPPTKKSKPKQHMDPRERPGHQSHGGTITTGGRGHNPFKRSPNLGKGPLGGYHDQVKCWHCRCGNIYTQGCVCTGTGASKDCPAGKKKKVKIKRAYREMYNTLYHHWRDRQHGSKTAQLHTPGRGSGEKSSRRGQFTQ